MSGWEYGRNTDLEQEGTEVVDVIHTLVGRGNHSSTHRARGYDFGKLGRRVAELFKIEGREVWSLKK